MARGKTFLLSLWALVQLAFLPLDHLVAIPQHSIMDFSSFNSAEQAHMTKVIEKKQVSRWIVAAVGNKQVTDVTSCGQMQDFLKMYTNLVERCFNACCNDFTSKALTSKEVSHHSTHDLNGCLNQSSKETCVMNCADKFLKHSERVGARFAEMNAGASSAP